MDLVTGVPGYLGRVLTEAGDPAGTCWQAAPGVVVTAWHVLDELGCGAEDDTVTVELLRGGQQRAAQVRRVDPLHDLAVVAIDPPWESCAAGIATSDTQRRRTPVGITGVGKLEDSGTKYQDQDTSGTWEGGTLREDEVLLGRVESRAVLPGMSGAPVRRDTDDVVIGVVSARYNSADGWFRDSVWIARIEDLRVLLDGVVDLAVQDPLPVSGTKVALTVTDTEVSLHGAGESVRAPHPGVRWALQNACTEARNARQRAGQRRRDPAGAEPARGGTTGAEEPNADASLRAAGRVLAETFLPEPVTAAWGRVLRRAEREHAAIRLGVQGGSWPWLPWEALPDPATGQPAALHPLVTVFRHHDGIPARPVPGPLRIVVAISAPIGDDVLDYERELRNLNAEVRAARQHNARIDVIPFATLPAIRAALETQPAHVLHLSGHGNPGVLVLEHDDGKPRPVDAATFLQEAIPPARMPPVIALAACHTAEPAGDQPSFATHLAQHGAPVVIATETTVTDRYATHLFTRLYAALAAHPDPDPISALAQARRTVQNDLLASANARDTTLLGYDEWAVITVHARAGTATILTPPCTDTAPAVRRASVQPGHFLGRGIGDFVGRRTEQRTLPTYLRGDQPTGVVLHGIGGVGKTALADELLTHLTTGTPDIAIAAVSGTLSIDRVLSTIAGALRQALLGSYDAELAQVIAFTERVDERWQDRLAALHRYALPRIPIVLVLDNFEDNLTTEAADAAGHAVADDNLAGLIGAWVTLPARLIITTRYTFTLPDDAHTALHWHPVAALTRAETRKLAWALPTLDILDNTEFDQLWHTVGGHPRTLEYLDALLARGRTRFTDVNTRVRRALEHRYGPDNAARMLATAPTLDAATATAITLIADDVLLHDLLATLDEPTTQLLLAASLYRRPVPEHALQFHLGHPDDTAAHAPDYQRADQAITAILERHNIPPDANDIPATVRAELAPHVAVLRELPTPPRTGPPRFTALLAAATATSLLSHHDGAVFVHRWTATELTEHWNTLDPAALQTAHRQAADYWQWRVAVWPQPRENDIADLLEARHHLLNAGDTTDAEQITESICDTLHRIGAYDHELDLINDTFSWLSPTSPAISTWQHQLGMLAQARGDLEQAEARYAASLEINVWLGDQAGIASSYGQLGNLAYARGDLEQAEARYAASLEIDERLGNQAGIATAYHQLGMLAQARGDLEQAEARYAASLEINVWLGDQAGIASSYGQLGNLAYARGDLEQAEARYAASLEIDERLGNQAGIATTYHQLGMLAQARGDLEQAEARYAASLEIKERLGNQAGIATTYHQLGMLAQARGDLEQAEAHYAASLEIKERLGNQAGIAATYHQVGNLAYKKGQVAEAIARLETALQLFQQNNIARSSASVLTRLGEIAAEQNLPSDAIRRHLEALTTRLELNADATENLIYLRRKGSQDPNLLSDAISQIAGDKPSATELFKLVIEPNSEPSSGTSDGAPESPTEN